MATLDSRITVGGEENLSLHEMFRIVGDQMTPRDVRVLKFLYIGVLPEDLWAQIHDGFTFLLALEKVGRCDASNFKHILHLLRIITRHDLTQYVTLRRRKTVVPDPVDLYLEETARSTTLMPSSLKRKYSALSEQAASCSTQQAPAETSLQPEAKLRRGRRSKKNGAKLETQSPVSPKEEGEIKKKVTCDIRLRVRAEYCHHDNALEGNIFSNKPELLERQFEKFTQANTILKSRDLGSIICDIKFSELTYLDAFWRDYINGSLLEALKGVFITESLKQAVGHEAIKLLVNVDEDDYEAGRVKLLQNLRD